MLLPSTFPASFEYSTSEQINQIRYSLIVWSKTGGRIFVMQLHLREPYRGIQQQYKINPLFQVSIRRQNLCGQRCCCCCFNFTEGLAKLALEVSSMSIMQNEPFFLRGLINNSKGSLHIRGYKINLQERLRQTLGRQFGTKYSTKLLYKCQTDVPIGSSHPFQVELKIPEDVRGYTAIGNIISRSYHIQLVAEVNCCYQSFSHSQHIILNNDIAPSTNGKKSLELTQDWNPKVLQKFLFFNLKPYQYNPHDLIRDRNQCGFINNGISMNQISIDRLVQ